MKTARKKSVLRDIFETFENEHILSLTDGTGKPGIRGFTRRKGFRTRPHVLSNEG